ncbi:MAG: hypothetical protein ACFNUT_01515, partial [Bacteroidota bacterium]
MAKEVAGFIKLQIKGGAANPSPPVGPALGSKGLNIMDFCKQFNARTQERAGKVLPVVITQADKTMTGAKGWYNTKTQEANLDGGVSMIGSD